MNVVILYSIIAGVYYVVNITLTPLDVLQYDFLNSLTFL